MRDPGGLPGVRPGPGLVRGGRHRGTRSGSCPAHPLHRPVRNLQSRWCSRAECGTSVTMAPNRLGRSMRITLVFIETLRARSRALNPGGGGEAPARTSARPRLHRHTDPQRTVADRGWGGAAGRMARDMDWSRATLYRRFKDASNGYLCGASGILGTLNRVPPMLLLLIDFSLLIRQLMAPWKHSCLAAPILSLHQSPHEVWSDNVILTREGFLLNIRGALSSVNLCSYPLGHTCLIFRDRPRKVRDLFLQKGYFSVTACWAITSNDA